MNVSNGQDTPTTVIRMDGGVGGVVAELTAGPDAGSRRWTIAACWCGIVLRPQPEPSGFRPGQGADERLLRPVGHLR